MDFSNDFSISGLWWLPDKNNRLYGELIYKKNEGICIILRDAFNGKDDLINYELQRYPVIYGIDKDGYHYSLLDAKGETYGRMDFYQTQLDIGFVLRDWIRHHYERGGFKITGFNFTTNFFTPFCYGQYKSMEGPYLKNSIVSTTLEVTPDFDFFENDLFRAYFFFDYSYRHGDTISKPTFTIEQDVHLKVDLKQEMTLAEIVAEANFIKDFFSFFCYKQISFNNFYITATNLSNNQQSKFEVLFLEKASRIGEYVRIEHILLPFKDFKNDLKLSFKGWIANRENIENGLSLYMDIVYLKLIQPVHAFMSIVFALETFHKTFYPKSSKSFDERLKDLIAENWSLLSNYIEDTEAFCKKVVDQRNYIAHDHSDRRAVLSSEQYSYYIAVLKMLFEISFLKKIGLTEISVKHIVERNFMYQHYKVR